MHPAAQQRLFFGALNPFNSNSNNWLGTFFQSSTLVTVTVPSTLVTAVRFYIVSGFTADKVLGNFT
jgi:hypothetical protein